MKLFTMARAVSLTAILLAGCGDGTNIRPQSGDSGDSRREAAAKNENIGRIGEVVDLPFDGVQPGGGAGGDFPVNTYLWRASLETLSFLPLASTDPFSGVIATDWSSTTGDSAERLKVTAFVKDARLRASSLQVAVYRQVRTPQGWAPAPVDPTTARKIEDAILTKARQLRIEERRAG